MVLYTPSNKMSHHTTLLAWQEEGITHEARPTAEYLAMHAAARLFKLFREVRRTAFNHGGYKEYVEPGTGPSGLPSDVDHPSLVLERELTALRCLSPDHRDLELCNSSIDTLFLWVGTSSNPSWLVIRGGWFS